MDRKVKIWVGVGAYLVASTSHPALMTGDAADGQGPIDLFPSAHAAGGEGSEGGEGVKKKAGGEGGEGSEGGEAAGGEGGEKAGGEGGEGSEGGEAAGGEGGEKAGGEGGEGSEGGEAAGGEGGEAAGGEGGEGGEGSAGPSFVATGDVNNRFFADLLIMKAHLRAGRELMATGDAEGAAELFGHTEHEVYPRLQEQLGLRGITPFIDRLEAMEHAAADGASDAEIRDAYGSALQAIEGAAATVGKPMLQSPAFVADVAGRLLQFAAHEYEEALEDGRVVRADEYRVGRGAMLEARDLIESAQPGLGEIAAHEYDEVKDDFAKLSAAFASTTPPADPIAVDEVEKVVEHAVHELEEIAEQAPGAAQGGEGGEMAGGEGGEKAGGEGGEGSEGGEGAEGGEGGEAGKSN